MLEQKILVPLDGSPISAQTVKGLIAMKDYLATPLTLLHVLDLERLSCQGFPDRNYIEFSRRARKEAREFIDRQQQIFADAGMATETLVREGNARDVICALADSGDYDLLVIGRNPVSELRDLLFGQVANYVVHRVNCPVLVI
ncbi:nucleotide-binding universal stress UspA family protein [Geothermobacter ehrlichii]|uniref:Nucleotide-binding universal stress UspA family protein n=1 Tax=Geothermobacter ehrlichii TaxID=213224 RepID=A0A5D3WP03_9BACT|nr:universal stress protein [Geothermobacter ehrlichii]TYO99379.1 nucleotide-binding universal stress UspA family protein [Geothermobacter ehrlichii]